MMMITNPIKIRQDWVRFFLFSMNIYLDLLLGKSCLCKCLRVSQLTLPIRQNLFLLFFAILNYSLRNIRIEESRGVSTTATILGHTIRLISDMMGTCRVSENQIISEKWLECKMKKDFLQFIPKISKEFLQFFLFLAAFDDFEGHQTGLSITSAIARWSEVGYFRFMKEPFQSRLQYDRYPWSGFWPRYYWCPNFQGGETKLPVQWHW